MVIVGRLEPSAKEGRYRLGNSAEFAALPFYASLNHPWTAAVAMGRSINRFWKVLSGVDRVWLLGPHPLSLVFAVLAIVRRRKVILGVRQDLPQYIGYRYPGSRLRAFVASTLEVAYRTLARLCNGVIVVGPALSSGYRHSKRLLEIAVSLVDEGDLVDPTEIDRRDYEGDLIALSVGRLDSEKNPLLLADVLAELKNRDPRWQLVVCGEGPMESELRTRLRSLDVADSAELRGYVANATGLRELYRRSSALLHVSWTEGVPQVLFEAFAACTPVVATDVGGISEIVNGAALLVPPGDPEAAADALARIGRDPALRQQLAIAGAQIVEQRTLQTETRRVATFLAAQ